MEKLMKVFKLLEIIFIRDDEDFFSEVNIFFLILLIITNHMLRRKK